MKEKDRYLVLKEFRETGRIIMFLRQPLFDLPGGTKYKADFLIFWEGGNVTVEDVKGHRTKEYIRSKKQVESLYPIEIQEK